MNNKSQERKIYIAPSILAAEPLNIKGSIDSLENNFDWLHLDIMDGHFVRNLSFSPEFAKALRKTYPESFIDTHLMIDELPVILPLFLDSGSSSITIHAETEPQLLHASLLQIKEHGLKNGVAVCPATPLESVKHILNIVDLVLVMSVTPGFGGQKLITETLDKVRELVSLREVYKYKFLIEMDGGINQNTYPEVIKAGCDVLVMGSAVFNNKNTKEFLEKIYQEAKKS